MDRDPNGLQERSSIMNALGYLTHGVYIVGTRRGRQHNAMTASWVMQTSERPPAIAVAIRSDRYTHDIVLETGTFSLSVLGEDQVNAATYFAETSGEYHEKFVGVPFGLTPTGSPYLLDCLAYLDCRILDTARAGDHTVMVAEISAADTLTHDIPLTYDSSEYERALS